MKNLKCMMTLGLLFSAISFSFAQPGKSNYFVLWGAVKHATGDACLHYAPNPQFPLPNTLSFTVYLNQGQKILTEQAPKWGPNEDPNIPGNGYYGIELGNFSDPGIHVGDSIRVVLTCGATSQRGLVTAKIEDSRPGSMQVDVILKETDLPKSPVQVKVKRRDNINVLTWSKEEGLTYSIFRRSVTDTLSNGWERFQYHRIATNISDPPFEDRTITPEEQYAYLLIARTTEGVESAHSLEVFDTPRPFKGYRDISLLKDTLIVIPEPNLGEIRIIDFDGKKISTFGKVGSVKQQLAEPIAVATDNRDNIWVLDRGNWCITKFNFAGDFQEQIDLMDLLSKRATDLRDLAVATKKLYLLSDKEILLLNLDGTVITTFNLAKTLAYPNQIEVFGNRIFIADPVNSEVAIFSSQDNRIKYDKTLKGNFTQPWSVAVDRTERILVSDSKKAKIFQFSPEGQLLKEFSAQAIGGLTAPRSIVANKNRLIIVDLERLMITSTHLNEVEPQLQFLEKGVATISWETDIETPSTIRFGVNRNLETIVPDEKLTKKHRIRIQKLHPLTKYYFQISNPFKTIPEVDFSKIYDFATPIWERSKTAFLRLPLVVILYTHAVNPDKLPAGAPPSQPISQAEVERIKAQIEDAVRFYWINSRMKLFLDVDFFVISQFLSVPSFSASFAPTYEVTKALLDSLGANIDDYVGGIRIIAEQKYDPEQKRWKLAGRGGGFTVGINPQKHWPGASWWRATPAEAGSGNNWLFVHEYHHQLDAMYHESGHPEYPFNHFSPLEFDGPFGEHFDGNAYILRTWPEMKWFLADWGQIQVAVDSDEDGIPDDLPEVPLDEKRFGSDPQKVDTDGAGLSDMDEVLASNWVVEGVGETWAGNFHLPDPRNPDTDGDGLKDGIDPYPLYAANPNIPKKTITLDGILAPNEWNYLYQIEDKRLKARVFANWDDKFLYFATELDRPETVKIQLDADDDGWFIGQDNYLIRIKPDEISDNGVSLKLFNCAVPGKYPFWDEEILKDEKILVKRGGSSGEYQVEVAIPRNTKTGIELQPQETIGVNIGFTYSPATKRLLNLFEPNSFFKIKLLK